MARRYRVGVVGFGVAGGAVAALLARDGHAVTLLERADRVGPVGAGIFLQPSGQQVLKHLGLLDEVVARSAPVGELYARRLDGRELIRTRYADFEPGATAYGVHRGVLFGAIQRLVEREPVEVRLGCEVTGREVIGSDVILTDAHGQRHGPFDFVLAVDGSRSTLRAACRLSARVHEYAHGCLWAIAPAKLPGRLLQVADGNRKLFGLFPLGDGLATLYWGVPARDFAAVRARGLPALKDEIRRFAPESAEVLDFILDFNQLLPVTYRHVHLRRWHDRHTLFLGDAAHAMSPHLAQGANLALVDAYRFARRLRAAGSPGEAFRRFVGEQRAYLRYYAAVTFLLSPFFQSDWSVLGWGRDRALPLMTRVPWLRRQMALTASGLKGGFLAGRTTV